jgi:hypothetical protein
MDKFFVEKAFAELREDESRKAQSLLQLRDWIAKHPILYKVRQGKEYFIDINLYEQFPFILR